MRKDVDRILTEKGIDAMLLYSDSFKNANMHYLTGFLAPDPFIFLKEIDKEPVMVVSQMEASRAKKESRVKDVRSFSDYDFARIVKSAPNLRVGGLKFVAAVAKKELGTDKPIYVPPNLSVALADILRNEGLKIKPMFDVVEKARETKEPDETEAIVSVQRTVEKAMSKAIELISNAEADAKGTLFYRENGEKKPLTVHKVRSVFEHVFVDNGCVTEEETMIACGPKSADPHYSGDPKDVLKANQPIVLDVFPKGVRNRYFTDMTRTIAKGRASKAFREMFETVLQVQNAALDAIKAGVPGNAMQNMCYDIFEKAGYQTIRGDKKIDKGYLHSLGHGVGLEVHEGPGMSEFHKHALEEHNVVTVEPGLYDPKVGGVRIEDIVEVTKTGCDKLTKMDVPFEV
ncbi:MAG TPA: Xaa-Pro peptidase family protein [Candidatus Bathyarchaeia archaeon]